MKTLCLYYTRTNTTKTAMEHLAKLLDADLAEYTDGKEISIMTGTDDILLPALVGGCAGSLTAFAAIYPKKVAELYKAVKEGDLITAKEIQFSFMPELRVADSETFPKGYKRLMGKVLNENFADKEVVK